MLRDLRAVRGDRDSLVDPNPHGLFSQFAKGLSAALHDLTGYGELALEFGILRAKLHTFGCFDDLKAVPLHDTQMRQHVLRQDHASRIADRISFRGLFIRLL